jgi:hypothetical protein
MAQTRLAPSAMGILTCFAASDVVVTQADFEPFGELVNREPLRDGAGSVDTYFYDGETAGAAEYHAKVQFFLVWFIEGARSVPDLRFSPVAIVFSIWLAFPSDLLK